MSAQTDRELLELAAKSAGYAFAGHDFLPEGAAWAHEIGAEPNYDGELPIFMWNPLHDDGDALRLAVKLGMQIDTRDPETRIYAMGAGDVVTEYHANRDALAATRRAIVRAAAALTQGA